MVHSPLAWRASKYAIREGSVTHPLPSLAPQGTHSVCVELAAASAITSLSTAEEGASLTRLRGRSDRQSGTKGSSPRSVVVRGQRSAVSEQRAQGSGQRAASRQEYKRQAWTRLRIASSYMRAVLRAGSRKQASPNLEWVTSRTAGITWHDIRGLWAQGSEKAPGSRIWESRRVLLMGCMGAGRQ